MLARSSTRRRRDRFARDDRPRWQDIPEEPDVDLDDDNPEQYDRLGMMMKIDGLDRAWRDLINEYGFSRVISLMGDGCQPKTAARMLATQRQNGRQESISWRSLR
ncbi:hypothetical protein [Bradyrhizobium betae]|uniref:hypothetical protein n=1 Tax=Bradyrhizobium betae TaxID=244734 RepID=UPI001AEE7C02|nr:hypothetical protein [Bradyrhizobium betae]